MDIRPARAAGTPTSRLPILGGGGPAPGLHGVVGVAAVRASLSGTEVFGILDGCRWIMQGNVDHLMPLAIEGVSRVLFGGGSHAAPRAHPMCSEAHRESRVISLLRLNVDRRITVGGGDTANSADMLNERSRGRIRVAYPSTTIANVVVLPQRGNICDFQNVRQVGTNTGRDPGCSAAQ